MTDDERRQIIEAVARGELTPQDAAERLDELEVATLSEPLPEPAPAGALTAVRVLSDFGDVRIYGDASVAGAVAVGPHEASQEGSTLRISTKWLDGGGWVFRDRRPRFRLRRDPEEQVEIRMNPRLALELRIRAGEVRVEGVEGPIRSEVQAGDVHIEGFRRPVAIDVAAGQVHARGRLEEGESYVRCKAGHVRLDLERGSSVRIRARATMGQIDLDGESYAALAGGTQDRIVGTGSGMLDIESSVGHVEVRTGA